MGDVVKLINEADGWRKTHRAHGRQIEALAAAIREHALLDALKAIGGDVRPWRKECGVLK